MPQVLLIGIDGLDWPLLESMIDELPTFKSIAESGFAGQMDSIFPPDSIPSWISIFTGDDPSEHGILESVDYFKKDCDQFSVDTSIFRNRTFWDKASEQGKKVIVVNPLMAYPPWKVNGIMVAGPVFISGHTSFYPDSLSRDFDIPPLGGIVGFPSKSELGDFYHNTKAETTRIVDFTSELMDNHNWDLTFVTLLTMDRVCHFYWRYFDTEDPTYPGETEYSDFIPDFLRFMDSCVKKLIDAANEDTIVMIISDHGHAMRPALFFNLNQLLMDHGLLKSKVKNLGLFGPRYFIDKAKNFTLETLHKLDLEDFAYKVAHILPWTKTLKDSKYMTNPSDNIATASSFGGNNAFGGVNISKEMCKKECLDYEEITDQVIKLLLGSTDSNNEPYFLWAKRREEIFKGDSVSKFPEILYELRPEFGTNWSIHLPLVTINPRHKKISGGHRSSSVLLVGPLSGRSVISDKITSINIASSVLSLLFDQDSIKPEHELAEYIHARSFISLKNVR